MRYEKHDFFHNFSGAVSSNDAELAKQIITNEIADLILNYPKSVVKAIQESDVKIKTPASDRDIVNALVENLGKNSLLRQRISALVLLNTNTIDEKEYMSLTGQGGIGGNVANAAEGIQQLVGSTAGGAKAGPAGAIVGAIAGATSAVFGFMKSKKDQEMQKKEMQMRLMEQINANRQKSSGLSTGAIIGISVGALALIAGVFFVARSMAKKG